MRKLTLFGTLYLLGCPEPVEIPECFTAEDCPNRVECRQRRCAVMATDAGPLDQGVHDRGANPDAHLAPFEFQCPTGCQCDAPALLPMDGDIALATFGNWVAASVSHEGNERLHLWNVGCPNAEILNTSPGDSTPMTPRLLGYAGKLGLVWRQGDTLYFSDRTPELDCVTSGEIHPLSSGSPITGVGLTHFEENYYIAGDPGGLIHLWWHDGINGGSTATEVEGRAPDLATNETGSWPLISLWATEVGELRSLRFAEDGIADESSRRSARGMWMQPKILPRNAREWLAVGYTNGEIRVASLSTDGSSLRSDQLVTSAAPQTLDFAHVQGPTFATVFDQPRGLALVRFDVESSLSAIKIAPFSPGHSPALSYESGRYGIAWVEPDLGIKHLSLTCE